MLQAEAKKDRHSKVMEYSSNFWALVLVLVLPIFICGGAFTIAVTKYSNKYSVQSFRLFLLEGIWLQQYATRTFLKVLEGWVLDSIIVRNIKLLYYEKLHAWVIYDNI